MLILLLSICSILLRSKNCFSGTLLVILHEEKKRDNKIKRKKYLLRFFKVYSNILFFLCVYFLRSEASKVKGNKLFTHLIISTLPLFPVRISFIFYNLYFRIIFVLYIFAIDFLAPQARQCINVNLSSL